MATFAPPPAKWQIGVDVGGTFTDLLALDPERGVFRVAKVLSTPEDQSIGFIAALAELETDLAAVPALVHASGPGNGRRETVTGSEFASKPLEGTVYLAGPVRPGNAPGSYANPMPQISARRWNRWLLEALSSAAVT